MSSAFLPLIGNMRLEVHDFTRIERVELLIDRKLQAAGQQEADLFSFAHDEVRVEAAVRRNLNDVDLSGIVGHEWQQTLRCCRSCGYEREHCFGAFTRSKDQRLGARLRAHEEIARLHRKFLCNLEEGYSRMGESHCSQSVKSCSP